MRKTHWDSTDFHYHLPFFILSYLIDRRRKDDLKEEMLKEKEAAIQERNKYWEKVLDTKLKEYQDSLSAKVNYIFKFGNIPVDIPS